MGNNSENLRGTAGYSKSSFYCFKNLKTDLDKLKSQIDNLKNIKLFFQIAARNKFEKGNLPGRLVLGIHRKQTQP